MKQRTYWVSPVEAAVEALRESNRALKALILSARAPDAPLQPLTMRLNGKFCLACTILDSLIWLMESIFKINFVLYCKAYYVPYYVHILKLVGVVIWRYFHY